QRADERERSVKNRARSWFSDARSGKIARDQAARRVPAWRQLQSQCLRSEASSRFVLNPTDLWPGHDRGCGTRRSPSSRDAHLVRARRETPGLPPTRGSAPSRLTETGGFADLELAQEPCAEPLLLAAGLPTQRIFLPRSPCRNNASASTLTLV